MGLTDDMLSNLNRLGLCLEKAFVFIFSTCSLASSETLSLKIYPFSMIKSAESDRSDC
jgi:hypothetical protein